MTQFNRLLQFAKYANCRAHSNTGCRYVYRYCDVRHRIDTLSYPIAVRHFIKQISCKLIPSVDGPSTMKPICVLLAFAHTFSCFRSGECFQIIRIKLRVIALLVWGF